MRKAKDISLTLRKREGRADVELELRLKGDGWLEEFKIHALSDKNSRFNMVAQAIQSALLAEVPEYGEPTVAPDRKGKN